MKQTKANLNKACDSISDIVTTCPEILIMAGTGLSELSESIQNKTILSYSDIPGFPETTVESHEGRLIFGKIENRNIAVMSGRFHLYEGYTAKEIAFPVRIMRELGTKTMIVTNASGGINPKFKEGGIMVIEDHINLTGHNPLIGKNNDAEGPRFPDMINAYDRNLRQLVHRIAEKNGISLFRGVYAGLCGPSLETPAEIRFLKTIGADSVGLSTIQEVIAAVHGGIRVLGLSVITNINNPDNPEPATLEGVVRVAEKTAPLLSALIQKTIGALNEIEM